MFQLQHIDHIAIAVSDLERSTNWYQQTLGLERRYQDVWPDVPVMLCAGQTCVALFRARDDHAASSSQAGGGMRHFAFVVDRDNFEKAQEELPSRGIDVQFQDHDICHSIYLSDPDGYRIEITTYEV